MVAPPRSRGGVLANQVAIYLNGIAKNNIFWAFSFACVSFKRAENTEGLARNKGFNTFLPHEIAIFRRCFSHGGAAKRFFSHLCTWFAHGFKDVFLTSAAEQPGIYIYIGGICGIHIIQCGPHAETHLRLCVSKSLAQLFSDETIFCQSVERMLLQPHPARRSINHVYKLNECYHTPPHPMSCAASTVCTRKRVVSRRPGGGPAR